MLSWPFSMIVHQPIATYIAFYIYQKKIFVRGIVRVIDLQRGVKTGINYPHTRLTTCIRVTKIPVWPTIVAENKDFCQHHLKLWMVFLGPRSKATFWDRLALGCQLRGEYDKITCFHPLEHFLYHIQSFKAHQSTFWYTFWLSGHWISPNVQKWPPQGPYPPRQIRKFWVNRSKFWNSVKRGWKYTKFATEIT